MSPGNAGVNGCWGPVDGPWLQAWLPRGPVAMVPVSLFLVWNFLMEQPSSWTIMVDLILYYTLIMHGITDN